MSGTRTLLFSAMLGLALWQAVVWATGLPRFILPGPLLVAETMWESRMLLAQHALVTFEEVLVGLVLGTLLGSLSAIALAASSFARQLVRPLLVFSQAIPVFALAPILTLWFGYGQGSKIVMALIIIYFPVTSSFLDALLRPNRDWEGLARLMGASRTRIMWHIRIPAALPGLASGLRLAAVYAPIGAIIGEWVGASEGLGYLMLLANGRAKTDLMFAALIVLAILTVLLHAAVGQGARAILERY
ncbi:ABC transporter permease [Maritimibacter sp. DP1N21-5]|uniref:ABC transporter permease n=1 Tax=Maritimibacter sp. DP1N21-5 TaxID=2836867 RepID=UPI001C44B3A2|nr:ABC transporter permease [Maritimibacter sp. DP1N21-5]MBV7407399.1 ABC transporter permease [Maritimibacter sp. DP1N21-5]